MSKRPKASGDPRARIPGVNRLIDMVRAAAPELDLPHELGARLARAVADALRGDSELAATPEFLRAFLRPLLRPGPAPAVNATGVILHTNLGRAPIRRETALAALSQTEGYTDLEIDPASGKRGSRHRHFAELARLVWGVEDALLVNNAAAAVCLSLAAIAGGREAVVSRGELIEIGGSFRLPDIMALAGVTLVEVGATNKTKPDDYRRAIGPQTACLMKTHPSNYRIEGFALETPLPELVAIGRERDTPVIMDLGSGLSRWMPFPSTPEPSIEDYLAMGPDLLMFSGDKLFGSVQAGIILGKADLIEKLRRHPMMRMVRLDKLGIALLCGQLRDTALAREHPLSRLALAGVDDLRRRATAIREACAPGLAMAIIEESAYVGGGSLPQEQRPSVALSLARANPSALAKRLRLGVPRVIGHIRDGSLRLNLASVFPEQDEALRQALQALPA